MVSRYANDLLIFCQKSERALDLLGLVDRGEDFIAMGRVLHASLDRLAHLAEDVAAVHDIRRVVRRPNVYARIGPGHADIIATGGVIVDSLS